MNKKQFKQHRLELGLEQKDLAKLLACSTALISAYEQEKRNADINKSPLRLEKYKKLIEEESFAVLYEKIVQLKLSIKNY